MPAEIFIKSIVFNFQSYRLFKNTIRKKYSSIKPRNCAFNDFSAWSVIATVLGIFTSFGDKTSTPLFLDCLEKEYLPKIDEIKNNKYVRICIYIDKTKLDARRKVSQST